MLQIIRKKLAKNLQKTCQKLAKKVAKASDLLECQSPDPG
jgi:hypothetical protein